VRTSGKIRSRQSRTLPARRLPDFIREHVAGGSMVHTDEFSGYFWLDFSEFAHKSVNHSQT
jgi:hypothetical protein